MTTDLGRVYTTGTSYRARAEQRQREYRAITLGAGCAQYGHLLDDAAIAAGRNFIVPEAEDAARAREAKGKGVDHARTWGNMLSSQAMCFNIFGTLALLEGGRDALASALASLGFSIAAVTSIDLEFTPPADVFRDQSARGGVDCDVLIRFVSSDGANGVLVVETKFVEPEFSTCGFRRKPAAATDRCTPGTCAGLDGSGCLYQSKKGYLYWQRASEARTLVDDVYASACPFGDHKWQLWTNHTLAHALISEGGVAMYAVCAPKANSALLATKDDDLGKLTEFSRWLKRPETFAFLAVEELIEALAETAPEFTRRAEWLEALRHRYVIA